MDLENNRAYFFVLASFLLLIVFLDLRGGFKLAFYKIKGHEEDKVADKNLVANKGEEETEKIPKPFPIENMNVRQTIFLVVTTFFPLKFGQLWQTLKLNKFL